MFPESSPASPPGVNRELASMEELWSDIARLLQAMETGKKGPAEEMEKAEAGWEEEMVRRNRLANLGLPSEEKQAVERFEDGVAAVVELERCRVPTPRTFFSRTGHWSDMELGAAVQQGLWEVKKNGLKKNHRRCLTFCELAGVQSCPSTSSPLQRAMAGALGREEGWQLSDTKHLPWWRQCCPSAKGYLGLGQGQRGNGRGAASPAVDKEGTCDAGSLCQP